MPNFNEILQKVNAFINGLPNKIKKLPETIKNAPKDEQIAYGAIAAGIVLIIVGLILL